MYVEAMQHLRTNNRAGTYKRLFSFESTGNNSPGKMYGKGFAGEENGGNPDRGARRSP